MWMSKTISSRSKPSGKSREALCSSTERSTSYEVRHDNGGSEEIMALLEQARDDDVIVRIDDGSEFLLSIIDDFDHEIVRTRRNEKLMMLLDSRTRQTRTIPLDEDERSLGFGD